MNFLYRGRLFMTAIEEIKAQMASQNNQLQSLSKAYEDLRKDMMTTDNAPQSSQIAYSPELKSKVFEKAPYFRFLESKGRVDDSFRVFDDIIRRFTF